LDHDPNSRFRTEVIVTIRKELLEIPVALQQMCEEGRPLYDALIRRINWGERPIFMVADGPSYPAAFGGAWAFESLLGMPVIVQRPEAFTAYTSRALAVRSLVIVIAGTGEHGETLAAAKKARSRGAIVWAVAPDPTGELARLADATVNDYAGESSGDNARWVFCRHAVLLFLAAAAARVLKPPSAALSAQEDELGKLAQHVEWVLNRIPDAARALAKEMAALPNLYVAGGGPFHPIALRAAERLGKTTGTMTRASELLDLQHALPRISQPGSGILYLSSSRCELRAQVQQSVRDARQKGGLKIFAVTDRNDHQLSERADLAVLLPILTEASSALLTLVLLELVACYAAQASSPADARQRRARKP
jgi:glucosamine 6-phosphate synthetase-like amidotransferase/phosphosugar isomerase protein